MIALLATIAQTAPESPDIIPDPDGKPRPSNIAGFLVALGMILAWLVVGYVLFRRARRRP